MKGLSARAQVYVLVILAVGVVLATRLLALVTPHQPELLVALCLLGALLQALKVEGATVRSSYSFSWMVYGAAFYLFGAPQAMLVILVAHLVEWAWHRYPWFIQSLNIASFAIALTLAEAAQALFGLIPFSAGGLRDVAGLLLGLAIFTAANHLIVGIAIKLARGQSLAESGVFTFSSLMIDFGLLSLGVSAALIVSINVFASIFILAVAVLLHNVLQVPALERKSALDAKTGLYNAQYFDQVAPKELDRSQKAGRPLSVAMADIDHLRDLNNTYGHLAGDAVLKKVAQILKASARDSDVVARFGGEEFCILMPNTTTGEAALQVEAMRKAIEAAEFTVASSPAPIKATMSFGVAACSDCVQTAKELIHNADLAVYRAKHLGRNRVCIFNAAEESGAPGATVLEEEAQVAQAESSPSTGGDQDTRSETSWTGAGPSMSAPAAGVTPASPVPGALAAGAHLPTAAAPAAARYTNVYVAGVLLAAGLLFFLLLRQAPPVNWEALAVFTLLAFLLEMAAIDIYARTSSVSTSVAALIASTLVFGPTGALAASVAVSVAAQIKHRAALNRFLFNTGNHLLGGLLCVVLAQLSGRPYAEWPVAIQILFALLAASIIYLSSTTLLAGVISLDSGVQFRQIWRERFSWLAPHYLALGFVAYALIFSYAAAGIIGVLVLLVPLSMLHISQRQYIHATKSMVNQLRTANAALVQQAEEVQVLNQELQLALASTIDLRDPFVVEHSRHVARYARLMALQLGLDPQRVELIHQAGLVHDIGKLAIPEAILFKPDRLTADEYAIVKEHAAAGADLLSNFHSLCQIATFVRHHHERYDGRGYPDGLKGEQIPLEARILALADAIEAMASDRPYSAGMQPEAILSEIAAEAGAQFDPQVVRAFESVVREHGSSLIVNSARLVVTDETATAGAPQSYPAWQPQFAAEG